MVFTTVVPTPARCASSAAAIAGPSFNSSSTRRRDAVSLSAVSSDWGAGRYTSSVLGASSADGTLIAMRSTAPDGISV